MNVTELIAGHLEKNLETLASRQFTKKPKADRFWISCSLLGACKRQVYFDSTDPINEPVSPGDRRGLLLKGNILHLVLQRAMEEFKLNEFKSMKVIHEEIFLDKEKRLSGSIDTVIRFKEVEETVVIDYKTKSTSGFDSIKRNGADLTHVLQVQGYMYHLNAKYGMVVYVDVDAYLDRGVTRVHWVDVPRGDLPVITYIDAVEAAWRVKVPPTMECTDQNQPPCSWCSYRQHCYSTKDAEVTTQTVVATADPAATTILLAPLFEGDGVMNDKVAPPQAESVEAPRKERMHYGW